jgi:hypothetical protein
MNCKSFQQHKKQRKEENRCPFGITQWQWVADPPGITICRDPLFTDTYQLICDEFYK